jgi:hypothetical protein
MNCDKFKLPTAKGIAEACRQFAGDNKVIEDALTDLFAKYPANRNEAQVLLKVLTLNELYSTRLPLHAPKRPTVFDVAKRIPTLGFDQAFREGSLEVVNAISTTQFPGKRRINRFAFATKYASWHKPDRYPIWDRNVHNYFICLRRLHRADWDRFAEGFKLSSNDWGYPQFYDLMVRFRAHYRLEQVSFKHLDKFLWIHGDPQ